MCKCFGKIIFNILTSSFFIFFAAESPFPIGELALRPFAAAVPVSEDAAASDLGLSDRGETVCVP